MSKNKGKVESSSNPSNTPLFRSLSKAYDEKQYKKGLKIADQLLQQYPNHGETLAMKGLILSNTGGKEKKEEAYALVRQGLKFGIMSSMCWHVYGLLHRGDYNYEEAIKCYKQALKLEQDNFLILRDLANLQVQQRDLSGYRSTCRSILGVKPKLRNSWIALVISNHLLGDYSTALQTLKLYKDTVMETEKNYENSEMFLYENELLELSGSSTQDVLKHLEESSKYIVDKMSYRERRAKLCRKLGRLEEAETLLKELLSINSEWYEVYYILQEIELEKYLKANPQKNAETLSADEKENVYVGFYEQMQKTFPKSISPRRLQLDVANKQFKQLFIKYVQYFLRRGVPSLFSDLKSLYKNPEKVQIMGKVYEDFETSLKATKKFPSSSSSVTSSTTTNDENKNNSNSNEGGKKGKKTKKNSEVQEKTETTTTTTTQKQEDSSSEEKEESPSVLQWLLHLRAQHLRYISKFDSSLSLIEEAIAIDPKVLEPYIAKARILKSMGDFTAAADAIDIPRLGDEADRWYNNKSALYHIRCHKIEEAENVVKKFTRPKGETQQNNLNDMQCMWWASELAKSYFQRGDFGMTLKYFHLIKKHFDDYVEDQFDFHSYCVRKMTLRDYMKLISFEDSIFSHPYYIRAALGAVKTYLVLVQEPGKCTSNAEDEFAHLPEKERKKALSKKRREEKRKETVEEPEGKQKTTDKNAKDDSQKEKEEDEDPRGEKLLRVEDPLKVASKTFLGNLNEFASDYLETHVLSLQVFALRKLYLLALRALNRGLNILSQSTATDKNKVTISQRARLVVCIHQFFVDYEKSKGELSANVKQIIDAERQTNLSASKVDELTNKEISAFPKSILHAIAGFQIKAIKGSNVEKDVSSWLASPLAKEQLSSSTVTNAFEALEHLNRFAPNLVPQFKSICESVWPRAKF